MQDIFFSATVGKHKCCCSFVNNWSLLRAKNILSFSLCPILPIVVLKEGDMHNWMLLFVWYWMWVGFVLCFNSFKWKRKGKKITKGVTWKPRVVFTITYIYIFAFVKKIVFFHYNSFSLGTWISLINHAFYFYWLCQLKNKSYNSYGCKPHISFSQSQLCRRAWDAVLQFSL